MTTCVCSCEYKRHFNRRVVSPCSGVILIHVLYFNIVKGTNCVYTCFATNSLQVKPILIKSPTHLIIMNILNKHPLYR